MSILKYLPICLILCIGNTLFAKPTDNLFRNLVRGAKVGAANLVFLRCICPDQFEENYGAHLQRDVITAGMSCLAYFNISSGIPSAVGMGASFAAMSAWGNVIAVKAATCPIELPLLPQEEEEDEKEGPSSDPTEQPN